MIIRKNVPNIIKKLIDSNIANHIVFTKFINYDSSNFYKILNYKDCMNEKDRKIVINTKDYKIIKKEYFMLASSMNSSDLLRILSAEKL